VCHVTTTEQEENKTGRKRIKQKETQKKVNAVEKNGIKMK
jgi:hypothetical protein